MAQIGYLHETFGVNYINRLVVPEVRSTVRRVAGRYTAEEIYATKQNEVESNIITETAEILAENNIVMQALLIRSINLPPDIKSAIESKLEFIYRSCYMFFWHESHGSRVTGTLF